MDKETYKFCIKRTLKLERKTFIESMLLKNQGQKITLTSKVKITSLAKVTLNEIINEVKVELK